MKQRTSNVSQPCVLAQLEPRVLLSVSTSNALLNGPDPAGAANGQYIVLLKDGVDPQTFANGLTKKGMEVRHVYNHAINAVAYRGAPLKDDPRVALIEPDLIMQASAQTIPTGIQRINTLQNAVANINGLDERVDVDIAIIDTGIQPNHPDLNVVGGRNFVNGASDGNWDDGYGHGTHVAGIAAALDNDIGVVGVAPGVRLWSVRVLDNNGSGYMSDIIRGIDWVTANASTIEVANMSLGGTGQSVALRTAIQNCVATGVVIVVAAGNDGRDVYGRDRKFGTNDDAIPAAYPEVATISALADSNGLSGGVGASTSYGPDDSFATFSNYSRSVTNNLVTSTGGAIDLMLPGVNIYSTYKGSTYATMSGTSMASPHAAGLAALYIAEHGRATNAAGVYAIRQVLIDGGVAQTDPEGLYIRNDPDANKENLGWASSGIIIPPDPVTDLAITSVSAPATATQGQTVPVSVVVKNEGNQPVSDVVVTLRDATDNLDIGTPTTINLAAGATTTLNFTWVTTTLGAHTLVASHNLVDDAISNNSASTSVQVVAPSAELALTSISPNSMVAGSTINVIVSGSGIQAGASLSFENGTGSAPTVSNIVVNPDGSSLTATLKTKSGGSKTNRVFDVRVTNSDGGSAVLLKAFTVMVAGSSGKSAVFGTTLIQAASAPGLGASSDSPSLIEELLADANGVLN